MLTRRFNLIFICLTVVIAVGAGILSPTAKADNRSKPTHRILKSASEFDYPPFALVRPDGSADGFSVDLLKAATQAVGLEINFIVGPWHKIKQELVDGHLDVLPLVSYSQEREKAYDFTAPYLQMHGTIFVRKKETAIRGRADLKDKEVIVMRGDTAHEYAVRENLSDKLILTATFEEAMRLLSKGKHDAVIIQQLVGLQLIKKLGISNVVNVSTFQETSLKPIDQPLSGFEQKFCFAVQDGDKELLALLNEGLAIAVANGTYDELYNKWFSPILPQPPVPLALILKHLLFILVPILFLLGIVGLWYLKREVAQKTQSLNKEIKYRKQAEEELSRLNLELEERVKQRTGQLEAEITVRMQAEETLGKNKEMLQMIFDGISDPLLMLNANLEVGLLNKAAFEYYFVDQKSVLGKLCYQAFRGRSAPCEGCRIQSAIQNHYYEMFERKGLMDSDKTEKVVIYPLEDGHDGLDSAIIRISDITQENMLQRRIVQTEKLSSLGFLVSGVAHEINNPNNFITFNIPILKEYLNEIIPIIDDYAKKHENLEVCCMPYPEFRNDIFKLVKNIENGSRRIQAAVSNLKGITRVKDKLQMDMIDIQEVIGKGVSICRGKINRVVKSFEVDIPEDIPRIFTDPETIELVIINLLINAAQAADKDNSWIRLHVSLGDSRQNHLIIEVSDNGCGMDEKTQNHIFEPFFTTKSPNEGTGLGLTLCLNSIKELGGQIEVDSIQGKGSTFKVILPDKENRPTKRL